MVSNDLADDFGQVAQTLGPKSLRVGVLEVVDFPDLDERMARALIITLEHFADRPAIVSGGVDEVKLAIGSEYPRRASWLVN